MTIDLKGLGLSAWDNLHRRYQRGEPIKRDEIHKALDSGDPVPVELNAMLREVVTRGYRTKQGQGKSEDVEMAAELEKLHGFISHMVATVEACIKDTTTIPHEWGHDLKFKVQNHARQLGAKRRRANYDVKAKTPKERAREVVGEMFGISASAVRDITKKKSYL